MDVSNVAKNATVTQVPERHVNSDFSTLHSDHPQITSTYSGGGGQTRFMLVWDADPTSTNHDILGGFYDAMLFASFCSPSGGFFDQAIACPCSNPAAGSGQGCNNSSATGGAILSSTRTASLSGDTVNFTAT